MAPSDSRQMPGSGAEQIPARLAAVRARIAAAAHDAGRDPTAVRIVAVSKFQPAAAVATALAAGQVDIGESRAQELTAKLDQVPDGVRWHFVGQLQRNKVNDVVGRVDLIHSVDRTRLAEAIAARAQRIGVVQRVLLQVNVAGEERKGGIRPEDLPALAERIAGLDGVEATGLMTIPPLDADPAAVFGRLRALRAQVADTVPGIVELSMGMSADLEAAVAQGATIVRIGTAIFGARPRTR